MKIALAADHAGFALKEKLKRFLEGAGHEVVDFGAGELNRDDDYPDFIIPAARALAKGEAERAIILGSSGQGEAVAANRTKGVRTLVYYGVASPLQEHAKVGMIRGIVETSREDNNSNVLSIGASFVGEEEAKEVVRAWLTAPFAGEERHVRRIEKLDQ